jgi:hypothetical protein
MRYFVIGTAASPLLLVRIDFLAGVCDALGTLGVWRRAPYWGNLLWDSQGDEVSADRARQIALGWGAPLDGQNRQPEPGDA